MTEEFLVFPPSAIEVSVFLRAAFLYRVDKLRHTVEITLLFLILRHLI